MGIITLRLNANEEKILKSLQDYLEEDKSKIIKNAMIDKFEDIQDISVIENFEKKQKNNKAIFKNADLIIKDLKKKYNKSV